jgi:type I restriction enzyme M protein
MAQMSKSSRNQRDNPQTELPISGLIDQKAALRNIRNYLAGQVIGLTRDESLLEEVLKCAFCRVHLEREGNAFSVGTQVDAETVARQYRQTFKSVCKKWVCPTCSTLN